MTVTVINNLQEFKTLISSGKPIIIDFWATWCGPCRAISPVFDKFSEQFTDGKVGFYKVDVDEQPEIAEEVGIRAMPTFILFKDGNKVSDRMGAAPPKLEALIAEASSLA